MNLLIPCFCLFLLFPDSGHSQDRRLVIRAALEHVLRNDISRCATLPCDPVRILVSKVDSTFVPADLRITLIPITTASMDSVRRNGRVLSLQHVDVAGDFATIRIIELSDARVSSSFAPAPNQSGFRDTGQGWELKLVRVRDGVWRVTTGKEWIS